LLGIFQGVQFILKLDVINMESDSFAELVFGFVYTVGTDADPVVRVLDHYLTQYKYKSKEFRVSEKL